MIDVGRIEVSAAIVKVHNLFESSKVSVMKVRATQSYVAQTGRAKLSDVVWVAGNLKAAGVFELWANADVMKLIVAEKSSSMTDIAS